MTGVQTCALPIYRRDQLSILKNSIAVIQPSLFEGWNTTIEDAKSLNKFVIVSDIDVHREQLVDRKAFFFKVGDEAGLIELLENAWNRHPYSEEHSYEENIVAFAKQFLKIIRESA